MKMIEMKRVLLFLFFLGFSGAQAQVRTGEIWQMAERHYATTRVPWRLPKIEGYQLLVCDFHIHTVFSDGLVWPTLRVDEAWSEGLDAIAITDHLEYRPHKEWIKGDFNESYRIAKTRGDQLGLIVIPGAEITRSKPLGHLNALFVQDANPLDTPDELDAVEAAYRQGAFIMWNHPGWPDCQSTLYDIHKQLLAQKKIHGIEIFNGYEYYPPVAGWCREYGVAYLGNSDIHAAVTTFYGGKPHSRPVNLVLAREKTAEGIREALFAGRTLTLFNQMVAGPRQYLLALANASLSFTLVSTDNKGARTFEVGNGSEIDCRLGFSGGNEVKVAGGTVRRISFPAGISNVQVLNFFSAENLFLELPLPLP